MNLLLALLAGLAVRTSGKILNLPWYLHLNDVDNFLAAKANDPGEFTECNRPCKANDPRICYIKLHVENYHTMGPACGQCAANVTADCNKVQCIPTDGFEKGIISINRQIPGPLLEVCKDDLLVMDVVNYMHSESFSIHWHGQLQRQTPYMDGVPYTTQCPINPMSRFRYTFYARDAGTYFYHSHSGMQRYNGAYGGLVVRTPLDLDAQKNEYDKDESEHTLVISDWSHESVEMFFIGLPTRKPGLFPQAILINGKGRFYHSPTNYQAATPYHTMFFTPGQRYRIRIVNAGSAVCPLQIQVQDHRMTIIATDGDDVKPETVDTLMIHTGERYDVVVNAVKKTGLYWFHAKLMGPCTDSNITQMAIISYASRAEIGEKLPTDPYDVDGFARGVALADHESYDCFKDPNNKCLTELQSLNSSYTAKLRNPKPDQRFYLRVQIAQLNTDTFFQPGKYLPFFNIRNRDIFISSVNGITHAPTKYPIISQRTEIDMTSFCNENNKPEHCKNEEFCLCTHIVNLKKNKLIEFVIIDESDSSFPVSHPFHFHGIKFMVTAQKRVHLPPGEFLTVDKVKAMEKRGDFVSTNPLPPIKDTVAVQNQGVVFMRFIADNPGPWLVHCHIEDHMAFGMGFLMLIEGQIPPPPKNFQRCGPFP